jgi:DNA-binding GntR family transcriptional regulator
MLERLKQIPKLGRSTLQESIYRGLKSALIAGDFEPGQQLTVRAIAEAAGTSPMPVREAMRRLVAERALEMLPNGTVRVCLMTIEHRAQAREIRMALEGLALRHAAARITEVELAELERLNGQINDAVRHGDAHAAVERNQAFHFAIYRAAHQDMLMDMIEALWAQNGPFVMAFLLDRLRVDGAKAMKHHMRFHPQIIEALRRRDADSAERAMRSDIGQTAVVTLAAEKNASERAKRPRPVAAARRRRA